MIPVKATFENLNDVIQEIFGWEHEHLWAFYMPELDIRFGPEMLDDVEDPGCTLRQVLEEGTKMRYVYDFGDSWEHSIVVEKLVENCEDCARVIKSKGAYMIEDCGGIWGYYDVIDEAQPFDMEAANAALARMPMGRFPKIALRLKDVLNHYKKEELLQIAGIHNVRCFQGQNKPKIIELISERLLDEAYMKSLIENCTSDTLQLFEDAIEEEGIECTQEDIEESLFLCCYGAYAEQESYAVPVDVIEAYHRICTPEFKVMMKKRWKWIKYCEAAVYLYGVLPVHKMAEIYNHYETEPVDQAELERYLEAVTQSGEEDQVVMIKQGMLMDYRLEEDDRYLALIREQQDVPYYIPETKEEFLNYTELGGQQPDEHFDELAEYLFVQLNLSVEMASVLIYATQDVIRRGRPFDEIMEASLFMNLPVHNKREKKKLFEKMETLRRHIRLWNLRGYTQEEMYPAAAKVIPFRGKK